VSAPEESREGGGKKGGRLEKRLGTCLFNVVPKETPPRGEELLLYSEDNLGKWAFGGRVSVSVLIREGRKIL